MKKIKYLLIFLFCFCILTNVQAISCDVNGDGSIDSADKETLDKVLAGNLSMPATGTEKFKRMDCNGDGKIDNKDSLATNKATKVSCGKIEKIPRKIPELTTWIVTFIQVLVPIILVLISMVDLIKAISSQKEDEIKKGQNVLIKRIVLAVIIFLFVAMVKLVISVVANASDSDNIVKCIDCFISDVDNCN